MAEQLDFSDDECEEVFEHLRQRVRQYGFHEVNDSLMYFIGKIEADIQQNSISSRKAINIYLDGLIEFLEIFSENSFKETENTFRDSFDLNTKVPFFLRLDSEARGRLIEEMIDLRNYQRCFYLVAEFKKIKALFSPNNSPNPRRNPRP